MKLLSLRLQGFMPYRDAQFLDFRDKSIFALVGPTGAGKSALLDAITFAFFGKTPRWADGRPGKELISQGEKKLTVQVEFQIKDAVYQISRVVKRGGSHAGHNGLRDIHDQLGSDDYWRLRLGIGHPGVKSEVINWVLKKPIAEHRDAINACIARSLPAIPFLLNDDVAKATMLLHTRPAPQNTSDSRG